MKTTLYSVRYSQTASRVIMRHSATAGFLVYCASWELSGRVPLSRADQRSKEDRRHLILATLQLLGCYLADTDLIWECCEQCFGFLLKKINLFILILLDGSVTLQWQETSDPKTGMPENGLSVLMASVLKPFDIRTSFYELDVSLAVQLTAVILWQISTAF